MSYKDIATKAALFISFALVAQGCVTYNPRNSNESSNRTTYGSSNKNKNSNNANNANSNKPSKSTTNSKPKKQPKPSRFTEPLDEVRNNPNPPPDKKKIWTGQNKPALPAPTP